MIEPQSSRSNNTEPADYDLVAAEYYDAQRHPTCANFGELSVRFLGERILKLAPPGSRILEVGAGRSIVAPILADAGRPLASLTLLDESAAMLAHSAEWQSRSVAMIVADACATALRAANYDVIVASLCDPYNRPAFWQEMTRLLSPNGCCLATLPAHEWVACFRDGGKIDDAEFVLADGRRIAMPSFVPPVERQLAMVAAAGLQVIDMATFSAADLTGTPSPKLNVFAPGSKAPVLRGLTSVKA
jgi:ubiquinone/menaquinone biosynthesis C-methylase UbiE